MSEPKNFFPGIATWQSPPRFAVHREERTVLVVNAWNQAECFARLSDWLEAHQGMSVETVEFGTHTLGTFLTVRLRGQL